MIFYSTPLMLPNVDSAYVSMMVNPHGVISQSPVISFTPWGLRSVKEYISFQMSASSNKLFEFVCTVFIDSDKVEKLAKL